MIGQGVQDPRFQIRLGDGAHIGADRFALIARGGTAERTLRSFHQTIRASFSKAKMNSLFAYIYILVFKSDIF